MIYEAKLLGAKAILLICAILDEKTLKRFFDLGNSLGLSCVVEAHDKDEVLMAKRIGARIIGVNNRNLKDFSVDVHNSIRYKDMVDDDTIFISESGIKTHDDIKVLEDNHVDAVLIGESIVKADDKEKVLKDLRGY
jgi:indole-3-glycerol phosphate synthase